VTREKGHGNEIELQYMYAPSTSKPRIDNEANYM
jgi:hypothetical protein